jgi:hypothetical protein
MQQPPTSSLAHGHCTALPARPITSSAWPKAATRSIHSTSPRHIVAATRGTATDCALSLGSHVSRRHPSCEAPGIGDAKRIGSLSHSATETRLHRLSPGGFLGRGLAEQSSQQLRAAAAARSYAARAARSRLAPRTSLSKLAGTIRSKAQPAQSASGCAENKGLHSGCLDV